MSQVEVEETYRSHSPVSIIRRRIKSIVAASGALAWPLLDSFTVAIVNGQMGKRLVRYEIEIGIGSLLFAVAVEWRSARWLLGGH